MSIDIVQVDERINASLVIAEGLRDTIETLRAYVCNGELLFFRDAMYIVYNLLKKMPYSLYN